MENRSSISLTESEFENDVVKKLAARIRRYTPVIFEGSKEGDGKLNHLGSSILLKWNEGYFLVMTAHTITKEAFYTTNGDQFFSIDGPKTSINNDRYDIRVIRFNQNYINELLANGFEFFDLNEVQVMHGDLTGMRYLIVGYPNTRVKKDSPKSKDWYAKLFAFRTGVMNNFYDTLKINKESNIIVRYKKDAVYNVDTKQRQQGPDIEGVSGCGIWRIATFKDANNSD